MTNVSNGTTSDKDLTLKDMALQKQSTIRKTLSTIPSDKNIRVPRTSLTVNLEEKEVGDGANADDILNHTCASGFGSKRTDKEFAKKQTKDYERSIVMLDMTDGVSLARGGGGAIQAKSRPRGPRDSFSSQNDTVLSRLNSMKAQMAYK